MCRCFRLVGGVLVERTVGEVRPAVTKYVVVVGCTCIVLITVFVRVLSDNSFSLDESLRSLTHSSLCVCVYQCLSDAAATRPHHPLG